MDAKIIFLLLPALVCAEIKIKVEVSSDQQYAKAEAFGEQVAIISDTERVTFGATDENLKNALTVSEGRRPDDVFLHSPTPWGDLYKRYDWNQVRTTLRPVSARVLGVNTSPVILAGKNFKNHSPYPAKYGGEISQQVETSITTTTSKGGSITVGQEVEYTFNFGAGNAGGKTSFSYNNNWGESITKTQKSTLNSGSSITVDLQPGQACRAVLSANQGTMEVEVEYEATLSGYVAYNYENPHRGSHFHFESIDDILRVLPGHRTSIRSKEIIKIGFYTDETVIVYNSNETVVAQNTTVGL